jgi:hypothetical protein
MRVKREKKKLKEETIPWNQRYQREKQLIFLD